MPSATYEGLQVAPKEIPQGLHPVGAETYSGLESAPTYKHPTAQAEHHPSTGAYSHEEGREAAPFAAEPSPSEKPQPVKGLKGRLNKKVYGIRAKWLLLGALILVIIIALGAGLGTGLSSRYGKYLFAYKGH